MLRLFCPQLHNGFVRSLNNTMLKNYMMDTDMTAAVDRLQIDVSEL